MKKKVKTTKKQILDGTKPEDWFKSKSLTNDLKQQLEEMGPKELKQAFADKPLSFGTAGIRAKMAPGTQNLNIFVYQQIMIGYCKYILSKNHRHPAIMIAHDNRIDSDNFAYVCATAARQMGITVYLTENNKLLPTPILSYAIRKYKLQGGVNITASHNPKEDNGFKAYNELGAQILPNESDAIIRFMPASKEILDLNHYYKKGKAAELKFINYKELTESFFEEVINATVIDKPFLLPKAPIKNLPIVFTGFHGTTTQLLPALLKKIGFKKIYVYPKHASISGKFEDCPISNPEDSRAFDDVIKYATKVKSTVIIGCDPDGDRMVMGFKKTNRWRFLSGNEMGAIFTHYVLNRRPYPNKTPLIITTHVSTSYIDRIAKKAGAEIMRTKTGFKFMCNMIDKLPEKYQFVLGFEEAIGALTHNVCRDKDSFGSTLLALEILNRGNAYFTDLHDYICDRLFDVYGPSFTQTYSYTIKSDNWRADAKTMMNRALHFRERKLFDYTIQRAYYHKESDCVVWDLDKDSWIKFRLSGTEPKFKVYIYFTNEMAGQLKAAAYMNITTIEKTILKGFKYTK